jgi:predicted Holliday junction resolvase-like endonuclease
MYIAVAAIIALPILAFVLYPLYRRPALQKASAGASDLSEREQNARQALQEVEFDFQLGNLDEKDYRSMRTRYMNRALAEMKARHEREQEIDAQIEQELRALREAEDNEPT